MRRATAVGLAIATIAVGLGVHLSGDALGPVARDVLGDMLWAMMMFWWIAALTPRTPVGARALGAVAVCWIVEASQLLHTPQLDRVRGTRVGHLFLGSGFDARDLAAYAVGVLLAVAVERVLDRRRAAGR